jgi:predicted phosphodiesterase
MLQKPTKYAIFSDIHGNVHALKAGLADAKVHGVDRHIFLGDYAHGFPWGNEVVDTIRSIDSAVVIRGNAEGYLIDLHNKPQTEWTLEQFKPVYWAYRSLSNANLAYLMSLPTTLSINDNSETISIMHSSGIFYRSQKIAPFHSEQLRKLMPEPFTHQQYLEIAQSAILSRSDALADINALPKGIYLFGHNHMQFHMGHDGRLFINPGSCGEALDWSATAAYTLLEREAGNWVVTERRVEYDLDAVVGGLRSSGYAEYAPVWSEVMKAELLTGKDCFLPFALHLIDTGMKLGHTDYPVSNDIWDAAVKTWDISQYY